VDSVEIPSNVKNVVKSTTSMITTKMDAKGMFVSKNTVENVGITTIQKEAAT